MKILIVARGVSKFPKADGGADALSLKYCEVLTSLENEVHFVSRGHVISPGIRSYSKDIRLSIGSANQIGYFFRAFLSSLSVSLYALKISRKIRPDVVHVNSSYSAILFSIFKRKVPIIYTMHDSIYYNYNDKVTIKIFRVVINLILEFLATRNVSHVIVPTPGDKRRVGKFGVKENMISTIMGGIMTFSLEELFQKEFSAKDDYNFPYILSVGKQDGRKRFDLLIKAMPLVNNEFKLILVGNGTERISLSNLVKSLGLGDRVLFVDYANKKDLESIYQQAKLYVIVSEREGFPGTIIESLSFGTPALYFTGNTNQNLDTIDKNDYLRIVKGLTVSEIADNINDCLENADKFDKKYIMKLASEFVFHKERALDLLVKIYRGDKDFIPNEVAY